MLYASVIPEAHRAALTDKTQWIQWNYEVERVMGIEPTWPAWKAGALPLSYTRTGNPIVIPRRLLSIFCAQSRLNSDTHAICLRAHEFAPAHRRSCPRPRKPS